MRDGRASGVAASADCAVGPVGDGPDAHSSSLSSSSSAAAAIGYASLSPGSSNSSSSAFFLMTTRLCSIVFEAAQQAQHAAPVAQKSQSYPTIGCGTQFVLDRRIWHARSTRRRRIVRNHPKRNSPGDLRLTGAQWSHWTCARASRCHGGGFRKNKKILLVTPARPHSAVRRRPWPQVTSRGILRVPRAEFADLGTHHSDRFFLGACPFPRGRSAPRW